jgi:hypothetical protein
MLSKCEIHNQNTVNNYTLDSDPVSTGFSSLKKFDPHIDERAIIDRVKQQAHGVWAAKNYRGGMTIDIEGTLQADTPAHVLVQSSLLTYALFGTPTDVVANRYMGTIFIRRLDFSEDWKANFTVVAFTAPITADSTIIDYLITIFCWDAWFTGVTSGTLFYWN